MLGAGQWLRVTDVPAQPLTFSLLVAPTNATINATNGLVLWRPMVTQAGSLNPFTVAVADNGTPPLGTTQSFTVTVPPLSPPGLAGATASNGTFRFAVSGDYVPDYLIQASTNLVGWTNLFITNAPVLPFSWSDPGTTNYRQRFYRVLLAP